MPVSDAILVGFFCRLYEICKCFEEVLKNATFCSKKVLDNFNETSQNLKKVRLFLSSSFERFAVMD